VGAAVSHVLERMEREQITEHVREVALYLEEKLDELVKDCEFFTERRGIGLLQGIESKKPVGEIAAKALDQGLLIITAGKNVLRFVPPLIIEKRHIDEMAEKLNITLKNI
ncbi:MAG: aminotransferase class III-fold pyridoxal phosphate-dependent enzyme, partial [Roseburia sp.]